MEMKKIFMVLLMMLLLNRAEAVEYESHDDRPISLEETLEVLTRTGEKGPSVVLSADKYIYGSLVASRKHKMSDEEIQMQITKFRKAIKGYGKTPVYVFSSIMRTPRDGASSGHMEPEYYKAYGADIFRYTQLIDKSEETPLSKREQKEKAFLQELIPKAVLSDWMERRKKNFEVNKALIDMTREGLITYLLVGRDDSAPYSQTHLESRYLKKYAADMDASRFKCIAGTDELGILLLSRAVNTLRREVPLVYVHYNWGRGGSTVPLYSDEPIDVSINDAISATGAIRVPAADRADFILAVNTAPDGSTGDGNSIENTDRAKNTYMAEVLSDYIAKGYKVALADVSHANGADNALMSALRDKALLYKLIAYSGWNTATNSTGFALATAEMTRYMSADDTDELLTVRYLDDWGYQANVRRTLTGQIGWFRGTGYYERLGDKKAAIEARASRLLQTFAERNLPPLGFEIRAEFPWDRMFEVRIVRE